MLPAELEPGYSHSGGAGATQAEPAASWGARAMMHSPSLTRRACKPVACLEVPKCAVLPSSQQKGGRRPVVTYSGRCLVSSRCDKEPSW